MKKWIFLICLLNGFFVLQAQQVVNVNPNTKGEPWLVGGYRELTQEEIDKIPELVLPATLTRSALPSRVDNSKNKYFRPIILQQDGSCSQSSGVAYSYTYEINFLRGLSSKDSVNQYPSHFTYNFLNGGSGKNGSNYTDGWQIIKENGVPGVVDYGGLYPIGDKGWMTGFNKYYN
jgi:hypothetical protein